MTTSFYIEKLKNREPFSYAMYSDGEWGCILGGLETTQHGCKCTPEFRELITESLKFKSDNFYFAQPVDLNMAGIGARRVERQLNSMGVEIDWHDKDLWDREMKSGGLGPLIRQLQEMDVFLIGNAMLEGCTFLKPKKVFALDFPNWHLDMDRWVKEILDFGQPGVYSISGAIGSCVLAQRLHGKIPQSWFIHFGSIWDGFVGMGAMRGMREEMYAPGRIPEFREKVKESRDKGNVPFEWFIPEEDQKAYKEWAMLNLKDIVNDWSFPTKFNP